MFEAPTLNISTILPVIIVAVWGLALMFIDLVLSAEHKHRTGWLTLVGLVPALAVTLTQWNNAAEGFYSQGLPTVTVDNFSTFLNVIYLITAILSVLISIGYVKRANIQRGEYYFLMLFSLCGMMLMGMSNDLILVFLALEILSIPLYILSGFDRNRLESEESALKYFLLGAFSSGFLVFGIALLYGATGSTNLSEIAVGLGSSGSTLAMAGVAMLIVGFAFKVGAVPFHMWTPDVYDGAPTAVTAFMSVGAKVGGFAAMLRIFALSFGGLVDQWAPAIAIVAALTMIVGNVAAVSQQNIKRMLAYSSIAHAGYILMAVASGVAGFSSALYYMLTYMFTNLGAFAIVIGLERHEGKQGLLLDDYKGLAKRHPGFAIVLMYIMLSLIGIPLTGGFTGKFYVFRSAIDSGLIWLAVVGALTSVVSAFYYLRPVYYAFMFDGPAKLQETTPTLRFALGVTVVATLILGFVPAPWYDLAQRAGMTALSNLAGG